MGCNIISDAIDSVGTASVGRGNEGVGAVSLPLFPLVKFPLLAESKSFSTCSSLLSFLFTKSGIVGSPPLATSRLGGGNGTDNRLCCCLGVPFSTAWWETVSRTTANTNDAERVYCRVLLLNEVRRTSLTLLALLVFGIGRLGTFL